MQHWAHWTNNCALCVLSVFCALRSVGTRFTRSQLEVISRLLCNAMQRCVCVCEREDSAELHGPGPEILTSPCIPKRGRRGEGRGLGVEGGREGGEGGLLSPPFVAFPHLEIVQKKIPADKLDVKVK